MSSSTVNAPGPDEVIVPEKFLRPGTPSSLEGIDSPVNSPEARHAAGSDQSPLKDASMLPSVPESDSVRRCGEARVGFGEGEAPRELRQLERGESGRELGAHVREVKRRGDGGDPSAIERDAKPRLAQALAHDAAEAEPREDRGNVRAREVGVELAAPGERLVERHEEMPLDARANVKGPRR